VVVLFGSAVFVAAGLVFLVQPMTAKMLLPTFGGSPQVWTAAMVFFQGALLAGYAWADISVRRFGQRQPLVHIVLLLLPALVLPIGLRGLDAAGTLPPAAAVVAILLVSVGAPYVAVSATSPLLQRWFSGTGHAAARDPYFLYAAGNVGSLLGLLGYPLLIEPRLPVAAQGVVWSAGYLAFALLCAACAIVLVRSPRVTAPLDEASAEAPAEALSWRRRLGWLVRAFVPSSLMLGVTTYSATDVAAVPLLWAIPLSLYLASFVVAFSRRQVLDARRWARVLPFTTALVILTIVGVLPIPIWARLGIHYLGFFVAAMVAHSQLAEDRPSPAHITTFYRPRAGRRPRWALQRDRGAGRVRRRARVPPRPRPGAAAAPDGHRDPCVCHPERGPPGAAARPGRAARDLRRGPCHARCGGPGTGHRRPRRSRRGRGGGWLAPAGRPPVRPRWEPGGARVPLSYYHPSGPAGQVFASLSRGATAGSTGAVAGELSVVIVGLGAGGLAAYGSPASTTPSSRSIRW